MLTEINYNNILFDPVVIIVITIILFQIFFFVKNVLRMRGFKSIFKEDKTWGIDHDIDTSFVSGIRGKGNKVFESIKDSINKYLGNNSGSVIEFSLLKDAVDRHYDSVESDINTLTPVPLYCGLVGTMAGVIVGLYSLLTTGSITALLSSDSNNFNSAAIGVNDLLSGVAWAMLASICGIILTTISSLIFKRYKQQAEAGKNTFLAWLQSRLLPELPTDTSDALNKLVKNLNRFNDEFASNTTELRGALRDVNESYRIQGDIIKAVHDMDVMRMAKANIQVLNELKESTDKLEQFNQYLTAVQGYTTAIQNFITRFEHEENRLHVLEEIQQFFMRHKAEIAKDTADADMTLRQALKTLKESAEENTSGLKIYFIEQAEKFKSIIKEEKESFENLSCHIREQFTEQLNQHTKQYTEQLERFPMLEKRFEEIAGIPGKLDELIERMERSNSELASQISSTLSKTAKDSVMTSTINKESRPVVVPPVFSNWMKWTIMISVIIIAFACISNTVHTIWFNKPVEVAIPFKKALNNANSLQEKNVNKPSVDSVFIEKESIDRSLKSE